VTLQQSINTKSILYASVCPETLLSDTVVQKPDEIYKHHLHVCIHLLLIIINDN